MLKLAAPIAAMLLVAGQASIPALAQGQNYGRPADSPENRAIGALRFSSTCAAREAPPTARKLLATEIASDAEAKAAKSLRGIARKCYQPQWRDFPPVAVRNAVAEVVYRERHLHSRPAPTAGSPPASFGVVKEGTTGTPTQEAAWSLAAIARCMVFVDPVDAHELVIGPALVPEEDRRFALLKPALAKCVAPQQAATLDARAMRGFIADALLTRTEAK